MAFKFLGQRQLGKLPSRWVPTILMVAIRDKVTWNGEFRSSRTGYSFQDLQDEFAFLKEVEVRQLFSRILAEQITKDRDLLLDKNLYS